MTAGSNGFSVIGKPLAKRSSDSTVSNCSSLATRSRPLSRVPAGAASPRRYLPVSSPLATAELPPGQRFPVSGIPMLPPSQLALVR